MVVFGRSYICLLFAFVLSALGACKKKNCPDIPTLVEVIPGSTYHQENGTWWGYNQQKIVRYQNRVFMAVVDNQNLDSGYPNASNPSTVYIYTKHSNDHWVKGAGFPTSRPVNLIMDSEGCLHVFVFEPTENNPSENGSLGKLQHYWFPESHLGNIQSYQSETVINHTAGQPETVNIRIGASIAENNVMYLSFGLNQDVKVYHKHIHDNSWISEDAGTNLGNSYYYPFITTKNHEPVVLAVQDDYVGPGLPAIYFKSKLFSKENGIWSNETLLDLSAHPLATTRNRLVDNCELFTDEHQNVFGIYQTLLDPEVSWKSKFYQFHKSASNEITTQEIPLEDDAINRIRAVAYGGQVYYFCVSYDHFYVKKGIDGPLREIHLPNFKSGNYIYLSNPSNGTSAHEDFLDILLLNGNAADYPNATNYYIRIAKSELLKL
jgi:hypothetical protein